MQFLILAYDYENGGLERRRAVREQHITLGDKMRAEGKYLMGVALLDKKGRMVGSAKVVQFATRKELDNYIKTEPYVTHNVWNKINVIPCKVGPTFARGGIDLKMRKGKSK